MRLPYWPEVVEKTLTVGSIVTLNFNDKEKVYSVVVCYLLLSLLTIHFHLITFRHASRLKNSSFFNFSRRD